MKTITTILLIAFTCNCYSQSEQSKPLIIQADTLFNAKKYSQAFDKYQMALQYDRSNTYPKIMMDSINEISLKKQKASFDSKQLLVDQQDSINKIKRVAAAKQHDSLRASKITPENKQYYKLNAEMAPLASHGQLTQFTDMDYNFVSERVQTFMYKQLGYSLIKSDLKGNNMVVEFTESVGLNQAKKMEFNFAVIPNENFFTIKNCEITGDYDMLLNFYIQYWSTKTKINTQQQGVLAQTKVLNDVAYLMNNKSGLYIDVKKGQ